MSKYKFTDCVDIVGQACKSFDGEKNYISTGAVDIDHISESGIEIVDYDSRPSRANLVCNANDIIFAKMMGTLKTLVIDDELSENIYSTGFCAVKAKKDIITTECLYHLLTSPTFLNQKDKNCSGATQKAITNAGLDKIVIRIPSLQEQQVISKQLDRLSKIIKMREEELVKLDELIKARFVEMFGNPANNEKGFIKAPMGDYMTVLTDFSSNGSYKTLDSGVTMYDEPNYAWMVRTTDLESGDMTAIKYIDEEAYELLAKSKIYGGEIIMNKIGSAGKIYLMPQIDMPASLGRNAFMFRYDERINVKFLYHLLTSEYGQREIQQYVRGAVTKTITKNDVRAVLIIVPPIELQNEFELFVEQVDKSKAVVQKGLDEAQMLFDSLMQQYFG
ncbi:hypothetical protein B6K86_09980 [Lachnospiraceae bacterium]|nr:hypothetical protein B6K86_09980 [Lachnospiraceae bacterium]